MRLFASEYWKCSETACVDNRMSNVKFVFAESLLKQDSSNLKEPISEERSIQTIILLFFPDLTDQINKFIYNHNGESGVQHVGFSCYKNITDAVKICKERGAEFLQPCLAYYSKVRKSIRFHRIVHFEHCLFLQDNNGSIIEKLGENIDELANLGILLDEEIDPTNEKQVKPK